MTTSPEGSVYAGLKEKVVLITGASSGIGAGCAEVFATQGSRLVLCGRNVENLQETALKCEQLGLSKDKILQVPGDVTKQEDLERTVSTALEYFGRLDVVIANAGIGVMGTVENLTVEQYEHQLDVNLKSVFRLLKLVIPELKKTKGNVIAVSSIAAVLNLPLFVAYSMSKAGLDKMIKCVALESAPFGVRVNCVNPGSIHTNIMKTSGMFPELPTKEQLDAFAAKSHPIGRSGNVYETGKAIAFLASDDASFITGITLLVDGGACLGGGAGLDQSLKELGK